MEKVSIILPTYNCAATVKVALESIIEQDYEAKEIIVCDGASTDDTLSIIKNYHDRIDMLISEPDEGIYDAMNKGANCATGQWLYFLGADDRFFNQCVLSEIFEQADTNKFGFIYGNILRGTTSNVYDGTFTFSKLLTKNISHQAIFIRKTLFEIIGGFELCYPLLADWDLNLKVWYSQNISKLYINKVIAYYGLNGASSCTDYSEEAREVLQRYTGKKSIYYLRKLMKSNLLHLKERALG